MGKSERVRCLGGPGGLRCRCCGGGEKPSARLLKRQLVKAFRRKDKAEAIRDGLADTTDRE